MFFPFPFLCCYFPNTDNHQSLSLSLSLAFSSVGLSSWSCWSSLSSAFFSVMASLGISEFFGLWGRGWGFFNPLISREDFRLYEMGALFGGGESTNWNMQQIQCMVEIWGDLPIRTHSLGWCHIRWPLFSRNWKMMFPKVWVFWWNMLLRSPEGKVFVGVFLDWSVFWLHEGVSLPAEHQHT